MATLPSDLPDEFERWLHAAHEARYSMKRLAQVVRMNPKQLRRFFQERFQRGPKDFLDDMRARRSAAALRAGFSGKEVAGAFHYRDAAHLNHSLKKHLGLTPAQLCPRQTRSPFARLESDPVTATRSAGTFLQAKGANLQGMSVG